MRQNNLRYLLCSISLVCFFISTASAEPIMNESQISLQVKVEASNAIQNCDFEYSSVALNVLSQKDGSCGYKSNNLQLHAHKLTAEKAAKLTSLEIVNLTIIVQ